MNDEEVEDFGGLESSITRTEGMETGAEGHSVPQAGPGEDSTSAAAPADEDHAAAATPLQVGRVALGLLGF
jgi:hypothetical protein